jgi:hypothetical protein
MNNYIKAILITSAFTGLSYAATDSDSGSEENYGTGIVFSDKENVKLKFNPVYEEGNEPETFIERQKRLLLEGLNHSDPSVQNEAIENAPNFIFESLLAEKIKPSKSAQDEADKRAALTDITSTRAFLTNSTVAHLEALDQLAEPKRQTSLCLTDRSVDSLLESLQDLHHRQSLKSSQLFALSALSPTKSNAVAQIAHARTQNKTTDDLTVPELIAGLDRDILLYETYGVLPYQIGYSELKHTMQSPMPVSQFVMPEFSPSDLLLLDELSKMSAVQIQSESTSESEEDPYGFSAFNSIDTSEDDLSPEDIDGALADLLSPEPAPVVVESAVARMRREFQERINATNAAQRAEEAIKARLAANKTRFQRR